GGRGGGDRSAHFSPTKTTADKPPATLSSKMLTDVLRHEIGFQGVIFTDAMNMRGVAAHYPEGEATVRALKAGADVILYPPSVEQGFTAIKQAVQSGEIKESRLDETVNRILSTKPKLSLDRNRFTHINKLENILAT